MMIIKRALSTPCFTAPQKRNVNKSNRLEGKVEIWDLNVNLTSSHSLKYSRKFPRKFKPVSS